MAEKTTQYVILGFLAQGVPLSGYEIRKLIELTVGHFWNESFGQLYPELQRLTSAGLISSAADPKSTRRRARYRITAAGKRALHAWLERPAPQERVRNELLLKVFFGSGVGDSVTLTHLQRAAERWREDVALFAETQSELLADPGAPDLVYSIITLRHGRWVRAARRRWAEEAIELLLLAAQRGNAAVIARVKKLEGALP
jgi:DNA-binding PadR family transcriptional regulator